MADSRSEASKALQDHLHAIDSLQQKLAAMPGCDKDRLARAVAKYKTAHQTFQDDALECVGS